MQMAENQSQLHGTTTVLGRNIEPYSEGGKDESQDLQSVASTNSVQVVRN